MKTKKIILLSLILIALIMSCTKQPYWEIPKDANGNAIITQVSTTASAGITALDGSFTVTGTMPNAPAGSVMTAELVKPQVPSWDPGGATQILPIAGSQKSVTVDGNQEISVTYTRAEATLAAVNDWCTVIFSGATESGIIRIDLKTAMSVSKPKVLGNDVTIINTSEVANIEVKVAPKLAAYTANLAVRIKNGTGGTWVASSVASPQPYLIPVAGTDFAANDTMFYEYTATVGSLSETVTSSLVVTEPYFWVAKKDVTVTTASGRDILVNKAKPTADPLCMLVANISSGAILLQAGSAFAGTIEFVPSTVAKFINNKSAVAKADFAAGTPTATANPGEGEGVFVFMMDDTNDTFYGMIMVTGVVPGVSVTLQYKIGDTYAHLDVIE